MEDVLSFSTEPARFRDSATHCARVLARRRETCSVRAKNLRAKFHEVELILDALDGKNVAFLPLLLLLLPLL